MLRGLTADRADVCAAMAFALDNAESGACVGWVVGAAACTAGVPAPRANALPLVSLPPSMAAPHRQSTHCHARLPSPPLHTLLGAATEVVDILSDSLALSETPIPLKIARLFLLSDILHNTSSGVRNASRYRRRVGVPGGV